MSWSNLVNLSKRRRQQKIPKITTEQSKPIFHIELSFEEAVWLTAFLGGVSREETISNNKKRHSPAFIAKYDSDIVYTLFDGLSKNDEILSARDIK